MKFSFTLTIPLVLMALLLNGCGFIGFSNDADHSQATGSVVFNLKLDLHKKRNQSNRDIAPGPVGTVDLRDLKGWGRNNHPPQPDKAEINRTIKVEK